MFLKSPGRFLLLFSGACLPSFATEFYLDSAFQPVITRPASRFTADTASNGTTAAHGLIHAVNGIPAQRVVKLNGDGSLNQNFQAQFMPVWQPSFRVFLRDGGKVVTASFEAPDTLLQFAVRQLNADGAWDDAFVPSYRGGLEAKLFRADDKLFVGFGDLVRLNDDGTVDPSFNAPSTPTSLLASTREGKVLVAGPYFDFRNGLARLNPDGTRDLTFEPRLVDTNLYFVNALHGTADGKVLVSYQSYPFGPSALATGPLLRVLPDGIQDETFSVDLDGLVYGITTMDDGRIFIAGNFTRVNGLARLRVARLNPNGSVDETFAPDEAADREPVQIGGPFSVLNNNYTNTLADPARKITLLEDGNVQVELSGPRATSFIRLHPNGSLQTNYHPIVETAGKIHDIFLQRDGRCVIWAMPFQDSLVHSISASPAFDGWHFVNGRVRPGLARILPDGSLDLNFATNLPASVGARIAGVTEAPDGSLLVWGHFTNVNTLAHSSLLRIGPDGTWDQQFQPVLVEPVYTFGNSSPIRGAIVQGASKTLLWGDFTNVNGQSRRGVVRVPTNGVVDEAFAPILDGDLTAVLAEDSGQLIICGDFTSVNGVPRTGIARLSLDGTLDNQFNPVIGGDVAGIIASGEGSFLIWGEFTNVNNVAHHRLAKIKMDGSLDTQFSVGSGPSGRLTSVRVLHGGKLFVWGGFSMFNDVRGHRGAALLNQDGSLAPLDAAVRLSGIGIDAVVPDLRGGALIAFDFEYRPRLLYLRRDGTAHSGLPRIGNDYAEGYGLHSLRRVTMDCEGRVVMAGEFSQLNGQPRFSLARLIPAPALERPRFEWTSGFSVDVNGRTGQVYSLEHSTNLIDWRAIGSITNEEAVGRLTHPATLEKSFYRVVVP